jgi:hypothetical protein
MLLTSYNKPASQQGSLRIEQVIAPARDAACGNMEELWLDIPGTDGAYRVSDMGRVKSVCRTIIDKNGHKRMIFEKVLKPINSKRYHVFNILFTTKRSVYKAHVLVLTAFVGQRPAGMLGCHNDGDPTNNRLDNLRWDTPLGNSRDAIRHGVLATGERVHGAILTERAVREIRSDHRSSSEIAPEYGVSSRAVWQVRTRRTWKHVV